MTEIKEDGWLKDGLGGIMEAAHPDNKGTDPDKTPAKTVMVYLMDKERIGREPLGIITERRKSERDVDNAIGMLRLARKSEVV